MKTYKITWVIYCMKGTTVDKLTFYVESKNKQQARERIDIDKMNEYVKENNYKLQLSVEKIK